MTSKNLVAGKEEERLTTCLPVGWHKNFFEKAEHAQEALLLPSLQKSWGYPEAIPVHPQAIQPFQPLNLFGTSSQASLNCASSLSFLTWPWTDILRNLLFPEQSQEHTCFLSYMVLCKLPKPNPYRPFVQRGWVCCLYFLCPPYLLHEIDLSPPLEEKQESTAL